MVEWPGRSHLLVKSIWQPTWSLPKYTWRKQNSLVWWDKDWTLNARLHFWRKPGHSLITRPIPSLQWSMVVAASCCWDFFSGRNWETSQDRWKYECSNVQRVFIQVPGWKPAPERSTSDWGDGSSFSRTTTQPRYQRSGFRTTVWMS